MDSRERPVGTVRSLAFGCGGCVMGLAFAALLVVLLGAICGAAAWSAVAAYRFLQGFW